MMKWVPLLGSVVFVAAASGQSLYSDNFNDGSAAGRLKVTGGADTGVLHPSINYAFDYAAAGLSIPAAPRGGGLGLKLDVNTLAGSNSAEGLNLYPLVGATPLNVSGDFALKFDVYQYAIGSSGTTEDAMGGINASGSRANWYWFGQTNPTAPGVTPGTDGLLYSATADGGAGGDEYISYIGNNAANNAINFRTSRDDVDDVPQQIFPASAGTPRGQWVTWEIRQIENKVTWKLNGQTVDSYDNSAGTFTSGTPFIGYQDEFDSVNNNVFGVFDNLNVTRAARFTGSGSFNSASNWSSGVVPAGNDALAAFTGGGGSVSLAGGASVSGMVFDSASPYTLANGSLTFATGGDSPYVDVRQGTHTISSTVNLTRTTVFQLEFGGQLNLTNLAAANANVIASGNGALAVNRLQLQGLKINGSQLTIASSAIPATNGSRLTSLDFYVTGDPLSESPSYQGKLDITNNGLVVDHADVPTQLATLTRLIQRAYNGGSWQGGAGITSSTAAAAVGSAHETAVGIAAASDVFTTPTIFMGASITPNSVLIRYTYVGDTNVDGTVDTLDFARLIGGFGTPAAPGANVGHWSLGDFDYNGQIDSTDFTRFVTNFGLTITPGQLPAFGSVVPEPAAAGLLALAPLLSRRRNRR